VQHIDVVTAENWITSAKTWRRLKVVFVIFGDVLDNDWWLLSSESSAIFSHALILLLLWWRRNPSRQSCPTLGTEEGGNMTNAWITVIAKSNSGRIVRLFVDFLIFHYVDCFTYQQDETTWSNSFNWLYLINHGEQIRAMMNDEPKQYCLLTAVWKKLLGLVVART